jgi:hypothetical protein
MLRGLRTTVLSGLITIPIAGTLFEDIHSILPVHAEKRAHAILTKIKCLKTPSAGSNESFDSSDIPILTVQALLSLLSSRDFAAIASLLYNSPLVLKVANTFILHLGPLAIVASLRRSFEKEDRWQLPFAVLALPAMLVSTYGVRKKFKSDHHCLERHRCIPSWCSGRAS